MWAFRLVVALTCLGFAAAGSTRAHQDPDLPAQADRQKQIQAETDRLVGRLGNVLAILEYYRLDDKVQKKLLEEAAGTLSGLSRNQMSKVIVSLEAAANAADSGKSVRELNEAHARHREILDSLQSLLARRDAVHSLDQLAARLDMASRVQMELHLVTGQLIHNTIERQDPKLTQARRDILFKQFPNVLMEAQKQGNSQGDLRKEIEIVLRQAAELRDRLPPGQQELLKRLDWDATQELRTNLDRAVFHLGSMVNAVDSWKAGHARQWEIARQLQELAGALREPKENLAALREARERLEETMHAQEALRADTREQKSAAAEARAEKAADLAAQQARLQFETQETGRRLKALAPGIANNVGQAQKAMAKAREALDKNGPDQALAAQTKAMDVLHAAVRDLDKRIAAAEKEKTDPLAALQKTADAVERLLKSQKEARNETKKARNEALGALAEKQSELARQAEELRTMASPIKEEISPTLNAAAQHMKQAARDLESKTSRDALGGQEQAVQALTEARDSIDKKMAEVAGRRRDSALLEDAAKKLDDLAARETKLADLLAAAKRDDKKVEETQDALLQAGKDISAKLKTPAAEAAAKAAEAAGHMEKAKNKLGEKELKAAKKQADQAAKKLADAKDAAERALDKLKAEELKDQMAMQDEASDPAAAAKQVAKALEQTREAAKEAKNAQALAGANRLTEEQKPAKMAKNEEAARSLAKSQEATDAAMASLGQAQAQAPKGIRPPLQEAAQKLAQARKQLQEKSPKTARQAHDQAVTRLEAALKALEQVSAMTNPKKNSTSARPSGKPRQTQEARSKASGQTKQADKQAQAARKVPGPPSSTARAGAQGEPDGRLDDSTPELKDAYGEGTFLSLPPRQREMIRQALSGQLPPEYAAMIQQYYINLARGRPVTRSVPAAPTK